VCEYCGCQALSAIDELTREHDLVVNLIGEVRTARAAADVPRLAALARRITAILDPHTEVEERGLFRALAGDFPEHVATLESEHRRIEAVLGEAATAAPNDPTWPRRLSEALDLLREHILKEQDGVFPAALATLSADDWAAVEAVRGSTKAESSRRTYSVQD
jgi:hemerythrin-like domain-containing protein